MSARRGSSAVSGAVIGIMMITQLDLSRRASPSSPYRDPAEAVDDALARLQQGFGTL